MKKRNTGLHALEALKDEPDLLARREEDDDFALEICLEKSPERIEFLRQWRYDVVLLQIRRRRRGCFFVYRHIFWVLQAETSEIRHALALGRAEKHCLPVFRQMLHERINRRLEAHIHDPIGLVQYEHLEVINVEARRLVQVLEHTTRRAHQDVHAPQPLGLLLQTLTSDHQAGRESVLAPNLAQHLKDLHGQLSRRADDQGAEPVVFGPSLAVELLEDWDEEGKRFSAPCLRGSEDVLALEGERDGGALNVGENFEVGGTEPGGGGFAEGEIGKVFEVGGLEVLSIASLGERIP